MNLLISVIMCGLLIKTGGSIPEKPQPQYNIELVNIILERGENTRLLVGKDVDEDFLREKARKEKKIYCFSNHKDFPTGISELIVENNKLVFYVEKPKSQPVYNYTEPFYDCPSCRRFQ